MQAGVVAACLQRRKTLLQLRPLRAPAGITLQFEGVGTAQQHCVAGRLFAQGLQRRHGLALAQ